jgi:immunity protein Imm5 of predicted polymorphic toxin system
VTDSVPSWRALPPELQSALQFASDALRNDPSGALPLPYRRAIWAALGPPTPRGPGHRRRVDLDVRTVQRVLPIWQSAHADDDRPLQMLQLAQSVLDGTVDADSATRTRDRFEVEVQDLEDEDFAPGYVGDAAVHAVVTAEVDHQPDAFPPQTRDEDLDADQWDTSYYAAAAASGTAPGDPSDDNQSQERRRGFWRWYLEEAVPAAYASA